MAKQIIINAINVGGPKGPKGEDGAGADPATTSTLGLVKVGAGLNIDADGTLSNPSAEVADNALAEAQDAVDRARLADGKADEALETAQDVESSLTNYATNQAVSEALAGYTKTEDLPTKLSDFTNDEGFQTESEVEDAINAKLTTVLDYKGSVADFDALPTDAKVGDVYNTEDTGANYAWDGENWDKLGDTVDLTGYYTKDETNDLLDTKLTTPTGGTAGQVLTKTATGEEWADAEGGSDINVVQDIGQSTTDVISQKAVTDELYLKDSSGNIERTKIRIGFHSSTRDNRQANYSMRLGLGTDATAEGAIAINASNSGSTTASGFNALAMTTGAEAKGDNSISFGGKATRKGEFNVKTGGLSEGGFNNDPDNRRLLTGIYPAQDNDDAVTLGQLKAKVPDAPTDDGNYVLKVTVSGGTPTYQWVAEA